MSSFRSDLLSRKDTVGSWIQIAHPTSAEILARTGFEWIGVDMEHADIDFADLAAVLRGMHGRGPVPIVRVQYNDVIQIRKALDLGAAGVLVPLIGSADEARRAVAAARYPPEGVRGFAFSRMNNWGLDFDAYADSANREIAVIAMVESRSGVDCIDDIVSVEGVDAVFIGPYDMSGSYGVPGQTESAVVQKACDRVIEACRSAGKSVGLHVVKPTQRNVQEARDRGYNLLCLGVDTVFLGSAAAEARSYL